MTIDLSLFEAGDPYPGDYAADLKALQQRLSRIQTAYRFGGHRAVILVEGWDASGKGGAIKRACAELDPRNLYVYPIGAPTPQEKARHFLWRFWSRLPGAGDIAIFDRSWYGRVLVERVEGFATADQVARGYDEINEFEAQQVFDGIVQVKLFFHVTQAEQDARLRDRLAEPWKRWKVNAEDFRNRARREEYLAALTDMFARTDTRWAPWTVIDGNNKQAARIAALGRIAEVLEAAHPIAPPPLSAEIAEVAREALG